MEEGKAFLLPMDLKDTLTKDMLLENLKNAKVRWFNYLTRYSSYKWCALSSQFMKSSFLNKIWKRCLELESAKRNL